VANVSDMQHIDLSPWSERGYEVLAGLNSPETTEHLGGPETAEQLRRRHERYLASSGGDGPMFLVLLGDRAVGSAGYWPREWQGERVYETGYGILPEYQGRGLAVAALRLCAERAAREGAFPWLHAFPSVDNGPSNAVCRKAGFELVGECEFEYPPGEIAPSNDWRLALGEAPSPTPSPGGASSS
jgi:RimJ/RimL family protein N-acetyltransferase